MANAIIKQNERLLRTRCSIIRIMGWVVLVLMLPFFAYGLFELQKGAEQINVFLRARYFVSFVMAFGGGITAIGVGQLLRFLLETNDKPGWVLRHGDKILYIFAILVFSSLLLNFCFLLSVRTGAWYFTVASLGPSTLLSLVKILVLIGLGQFLRRIIPVIEEAKVIV